MNEQAVIDLAAQSVLVAMKIAAPALIAIMLMGFVISLFQAATQISEQTLSFIPKIIAMSAAMFVTGPWILHTIVFFTKQIFERIPGITR